MLNWLHAHPPNFDNFFFFGCTKKKKLSLPKREKNFNAETSGATRKCCNFFAKVFIHNAEVRSKMKIKIGDYVRTLNSKTIFDKEGERYSKIVYVVVGIVGNKYELKNEKTDNVLQKKYGINELSKINNAFDVFESPNEGRKEEVVKEHKTDVKVRKEGLDKENIVSEARPKRSVVSKELWKNL